MTSENNDVSNLIASLSVDEVSYLRILSYPTRISRYSLSFFASDRNASLAYNWLKRKKSLHTKHASGDLFAQR